METLLYNSTEEDRGLQELQNQKGPGLTLGQQLPQSSPVIPVQQKEGRNQALQVDAGAGGNSPQGQSTSPEMPFRDQATACEKGGPYALSSAVDPATIPGTGDPFPKQKEHQIQELKRRIEPLLVTGEEDIDVDLPVGMFLHLLDLKLSMLEIQLVLYLALVVPFGSDMAPLGK